MPSLQREEISLAAFNATLSRYSDTTSTALKDLDELRYETIPQKLVNMKGERNLQKSDVEKLVEWKLKHGTYRPALLGLVKSNPADLIKSTTKEAFASLSTTDDVMKALKILTKLRGIGPATASLLLSVYQPDEVPFFSDELFRWTHWEEKGKTGWGRTIKYNVTEYKQVLVRIEELRGRLGARAVDAERVAYVLGNEAVDVEVEVEVEGSKDGEKNEGEAVGEKVEEDTESDENIVEAAAANTDEKKLSAVPSNDRVKKEGKTIEEKEESGKIVTKTGKTETSEGKGAKQSATKGTKRKAQEERTSTEGTRRSTRRRV